MPRHEAVEANAIANSDMVTTVTSEDKDKICEHFGTSKKKVEVCPNGADTKKYHPVSDHEKIALKKKLGLPKEKKAVLFCGSIHYPNILAAEFIEKTLQKQLSGEKVFFIVIGKAAENRQSGKSAYFVGEVPEITDYLNAADIAINPVEIGSGSNIKMFEYMAAGLPIISTKIGARGIEAKNEKHLMISDTDDFPETIRKLISDMELAKKIGRNARKLAEKKYDWKKITDKLGNRYKKLLKQG